MSDYTTTPNLGLYKPNYALDVGQWGNHLNANADVLDQVVGSERIVASISSSATITLPLNSIIHLTGTTTVTTIVSESGADARQVTFIPSGTVIFQSGPGIPVGATTVANIPLLAVFDGTDWFLK